MVRVSGWVLLVGCLLPGGISARRGKDLVIRRRILHEWRDVQSSGLVLGQRCARATHKSLARGPLPPASPGALCVYVHPLACECSLRQFRQRQ
jgi:hypothetical protein